MSSKDLLAKLQAAGLEVKAAASAVDEAVALKALGGNGSAPASGKASAETPPDAPAAPDADADAEAPAAGTQTGRRERPTRDSLQGERAPNSAGGVRRVVIDASASRRTDGPQRPQGGGPGGRRPRRGGGRRRRLEEALAPREINAPSKLDAIRIHSGSTVKETAESLGVPIPEIIKKLMSLGEMATLTQTLSDEAIQVLADEFDKESRSSHASDEISRGRRLR